MNLPLLSSLALAAQQVVSAPLDEGATGTFWFPPQASTLAPETDWVFYYVYWISVVFTSIIVGVMIFFLLRYRHRKGWDGEKSASHGLALEITWSVIPFLLTTVMWWKGYETFMVSNTVPDNAFTIQVKASQWTWDFVYPNGLETKELHLPPDEPVTFVMQSKDVIHSFWIPAFRVKKDIVPGRYTKTWAEATEPGIYTLFCTEYCGMDHSEMLTSVVVHASQETIDTMRAGGEQFKYGKSALGTSFEDWYEAASKDFLAKYEGKEPWEIGEMVYTGRACNACHTLDGSVLVGPSWKGAWGTERQLEGGATAVFDENYVRESIYDPSAKIVAGFPATMTTYTGLVDDQELDGLIAFFKKLAE
ncbi:MAG: cytochrome c oxidase subunit II [Planctomycetota bacterium]|nr:cytochrome c oxidase subunit II [Planctomycetota bacterium]